MITILTILTIERLDGRAGRWPDPPPIAMQKNAMLSIAQPLGLRIGCTAGCLWITQDGDPRDTLLSAGEHHIVEGRSRLIVQALEAGVVHIASSGHPVSIARTCRPAASAATAMGTA